MNIEEKLVSGAPEKIYALTDSLFEFREAVRNGARAETAGIQYLFDLYPAAYYRHTATADMILDCEHPWSQELLESYNSQKHCHAAASVVLRIADAIVENSIIYCKQGENVSVLYETYRFPERAVHSLSSASMLEMEVTDFQCENRDYLYLGSSGSFNYGHWLVDDLPRAKAWLELRRRAGVMCVVILPSYGDKIDKIRVQSLQILIDPAIKVQFIPPDRPCRIRNLYYATPVTFHPRIKNPGAINFLRSRASLCLPQEQEEPSRKLFVARRPPNSRAIVNFQELLEFLEERGFEVVEAEKLDFAEQVALFQSASVIVGQMGAAMTNTVFCRSATSLIYIAPIGWKEPFYLDLAAIGGQQYQVLFGPSIGDKPAHLSDFQAPVDHLYHRLTYMGFRELL